MADSNQSPLVTPLASPLTAHYTYQTIVCTFSLFYNSMRLSKCGPERRLYSGTVREVSATKLSRISWEILNMGLSQDSFSIRTHGVKMLLHVAPSKLAESPCLYPKSP